MRGSRILRRASLVVVLGLVLLMALPSAMAGSGTGSIAIGQPGTIARGVTETEFRNQRFCGSTPTSQGVDGYIVDLGGAAGSFTVTGNSPGPFSLNVIFIAPNCVSTTGFFLTNLGSVQRTSISGGIPINSKWMVVSAAYGANISLSYSTT